MTTPTTFSGLRRRFRRWRDDARARRHFDRRLLERAHEQHRLLLAAVPQWVSDETLRTSVFRYGIPEEIRELIDRDVGAGISYTDALACLAGTLKKPVRYLEIGVSVGKNFWPMIHHVGDGRAVAFDIEEMTPVLRGLLVPQSAQTWATMPGSMKKTHS